MKIFKKNKFISNNEGFSLMEIVVAIGIIVVGVMAILSLFSASMKSEVNNKNRVIATYLAQEAIEVIRLNRDNLWFGGTSNTFIDKAEFGDGEVIVYPNDEDDLTQGWSFGAVADEAYKKVYIKDGYYFQKNDGVSASEDSGFERYVEIINNYDGSGERCDVVNCMKLKAIVTYHGETMASIDAFLYDYWY